MVTGIDLVAAQLRIADGGEFGHRQEDISLAGTAIECRVNAEDPTNDFAPCPGQLTWCTFPAGPAVRVDTHVFAGYTVPPYYDPLLAKVSTWAPDRARAVARMKAALDEIHLDGRGLRTNVEFIMRLLSDPRFLSCSHSTTLAESIVNESGK
jgi:acetyl-CoA carboxylase biotin carboxylase subunit